MKQYAGSRKVVIIQNPGKGNIEQAIFIIKREVKNCDEDYIIDEAKKIINDFARKNIKMCKNQARVNILVTIFTILAVGFAGYMLFFGN